MKVLLIAYSFPPLLEPQSLRWYYLCRELAKKGLKIDVLTIDYPSDFQCFEGVRVFRTFPGPFGKVIYRALSNPSVFSAKRRKTLKFLVLKKLYRGVRRLLEHLLLGDLRNEWLPIGYYHALRLIEREKYELLITSHEPMVDTFLGLLLKKKTGVSWLADLGDPISADYYPWQWKPILKKIERIVVEKADGVLVTTEALKEEYEKLCEKKEKIFVITQGFDEELLKIHRTRERTKNEKFTLVYTGSFYKDFRSPARLVEALKRVDFDFELLLAGRLEGFLSMFEPVKDKIRYLGVLPHEKALEVQAKADVLLYLGNKFERQVSGKFFEYLGSQRPILCIIQSERDPVSDLVKTFKAGISCLNEINDIYKALKELYELWVRDELDKSFPYDVEKMKEFSWQNQAQKLFEFILSLKETF